MCGIAAIVAPVGEPSQLEAVEQMAAVLAHRGPDDTGSLATGSVAFGFRRLSILDLSDAGHQPMVSPDGQVAIVFNGEIYNYTELREELRAKGHEFRSMGDTEVLLAAYLEWGLDCLSRLNGMWAFVIHDARTGCVVGSRDRLGVKPLYHATLNGRHYLASEIKALQAVLPAARTIALDRVAVLLAAGTLEAIPEDGRTFFSAVRQVDPGSWFVIEPDGAWRAGRFWELPEEGDDGGASCPEAFAELFLSAVALRLRSDVPVGVALSGGLDSTAIISAMAGFREEAGARGGMSPLLHAFSYLPAQFGETRYVRETVARTGAQLHEVVSNPLRFWEQLPGYLRCQDEPVHSLSAWVGFEIYRTARAAGVPVVLGGQGADEAWGGYPSYFPEWWQTLLQRRQWRRAWKEIADFSQGHGTSRAVLLYRTGLRYVLSSADRIAAYRAMMRTRRFRTRFPYQGLLGPALRDLLPDSFEAWPSGDLSAGLRWGLARSPLPLYLRIEDRNSMGNSVEARLPFMDYRLVEMACRLAAHLKIRGRWNKYVVREGIRGLVPESIRTRVDKMGFPHEFGDWLRGPLSAEALECFQGALFGATGWADRNQAIDLLERHKRGEGDLSRPLFNLMQLPAWKGGL